MASAAIKFLFLQVIPRLPLLARLTLAHSLGLLETSSKWDLRTTLIVRFLRALFSGDKPTTVTRQQTFSTRDPGISGPIWVSSITIPELKQDDNVLSLLLQAIDARKEPGAKYDIPESEPIYAEWTGYRKGANKKTPHAKELSDAVRYQKLVADTTNDATVLYMHGGAMYLMDVASHRPVCQKLARGTGGRCFNIRYRLAPKYPFPAQILDCLTAYIYLLSPPEGSFHEPVPASKIVFAGDSAGGNLSCALLQLLLQLHRTSPNGKVPTVQWQGREVDLPLPAGVAGSSAWLDLTRTMPSMINNFKYDYLPRPTGKSLYETIAPCALWPTKERREDLYCDGTIMMHPFASPLATTSEDWENSPPIFLFYGEEMITDEGKYFARKVARAGVAVQWEEFEGMPHCFGELLQGTKVSRLSTALWSDFIVRVTRGDTIETQGRYYKAKVWTEKAVDVLNLGDLSDQEVWDRMTEEVKVREGYITAAKERGDSIRIQSKL